MKATTRRTLTLLTLLIGTTACGDAMQAEPVEEPQTRLGTPVFYDTVVHPADEDDEVKTVGRIDDPVYTDAWTNRDDEPFSVDIPKCSEVSRRVSLSPGEISSTRAHAVDALQARAFTLCGGFEQARLTNVSFEDVSFEEETVTVCANSSGEQVDLQTTEEVFGTTAGARVICGDPMLRPTVAAPVLGRPQPMPFEIHEVDYQPTCTIERGYACCQDLECCIAKGGAEGYCQERFAQNDQLIRWWFHTFSRGEPHV